MYLRIFCFQCVFIMGDGNCLFCVVSFFFYGYQNNYVYLRNLVVDILRVNIVEFLDYFLLDRGIVLE